MQRSRVISIFVGLVLAALATVMMKNAAPSASPADAGLAGGVASRTGPEGRPAPPSYLAAAADGTEQRVVVPDVDPTGEDIPVAALAAYQRAADILAAIKPECGLDWALLAAVARVESDHGRDASEPDPSGAPSAGPFRVRPETWNVVGVDGDGDGTRSAEDVDDAALAVAVYLCSGSEDLRHEEGARAALARYDASPAWAALVLVYADLYRNGDFGTWRDGETAVVTAVLTGPRLSATSLGRSALDIAEKRAALPARVMATVRADAREAVEAAEDADDAGDADEPGGGRPAADGLTTQVEPPALVAPEPSEEEVRSFALGAPVGEDPAVLAAEQREATQPSASPSAPSSASPSGSTPSGSASSSPTPSGSGSSEPDPPSGSSSPTPGSSGSATPEPSGPAEDSGSPEPSADPDPEPQPSTSPDPDPEPEPSASADPEPEPSASAEPEPSGDPSGSSTPAPSPEASPSTSESAEVEESPAASPSCDPTTVDLSLLSDALDPCE